MNQELIHGINKIPSPVRISRFIFYVFGKYCDLYLPKNPRFQSVISNPMSSDLDDMFQCELHVTIPFRVYRFFSGVRFG